MPLKEEEELIPDDVVVVNVLNKNFVSYVLCLTEESGCSAHVIDMNAKKDSLDDIITRFQHQPSIIAIERRRRAPEYHKHSITQNFLQMMFHQNRANWITQNL